MQLQSGQHNQTLEHTGVLASSRATQYATAAPIDNDSDMHTTEIDLNLARVEASAPESTLYLEVDFESPVDATKGDNAAARPEAAEPTDVPGMQALELAANRAELARLARAQEELERAVRLRDGWLSGVRNELKVLQEARRSVDLQLEEAQARLAQLTDLLVQKDARIASLEEEIAHPVQSHLFSHETPEAAASAKDFEPDATHVLEPVGHDSDPIVLNRKVMTIGRTDESDVCVPSPLVSRDHARLLISPGSVMIFDIGSINGCFVNDRPVKKHALREGDLLRIADRCYRLMAMSRR